MVNNFVVLVNFAEVREGSDTCYITFNIDLNVSLQVLQTVISSCCTVYACSRGEAFDKSDWDDTGM